MTREERNKKIRPIINHILRKCEDAGLTYEELVYLSNDLKFAIDDCHRDQLRQVFVRVRACDFKQDATVLFDEQTSD